MRILLIGEYSRLHNTLKEGLTALGHEVVLVGTNDGFKNFPVDINYKATFFTKPFFRPFIKAFYRLTAVNLIQVENAWRFRKTLPKLKDFDVVQLINESSIKTLPRLEIKLLKKIARQNKHLFLMSCGTDHMSVSYAMDKKLRYSILSPLHENPGLKAHYKFILRYLSKPYVSLHQFLYKAIDGVIASDLDYHLPLEGHPKYLGMVPNPIHVKALDYMPLTIQDKIVIFHGVNKSNYIKKGNRFFDEALDIIRKKYPENIHIISTADVPYDTYINAYNLCHIFLDQVYAFDQGFNALEAMAKGKVVFTGAEKEWLTYYELEEDTVAINALPDANEIASKLEWLIEHPEKILEISQKARDFVIKEHDHINSAKHYLKLWQS